MLRTLSPVVKEPGKIRGPIAGARFHSSFVQRRLSLSPENIFAASEGGFPRLPAGQIKAEGFIKASWV